MRIGLFTYGMGKHLTGIGRYTQDLCYALSRLRDDIEIVLINPYPPANQLFFKDFENYSIPLLRSLPSVLATGPFVIPSVSRRLQLDIIHDPCGISPFLFPPTKKSIPRVVTVHDAVPYVFPRVQPFLTKLTFQTFIRASKRSVNAIITVSESARDDLIRYVGFSPDQVHVTYEGVVIPSDNELRQYRQQGSTVLSKYGVSNKYFLYVGALNPRKNLPTLIAAFSKVLKVRGDVRLVLVGPKTWWADETLHCAKGLGDSVVVTGYIEESELHCLYANAAALVYPSIYEGFGLPPLEAMAHGTPVITSNTSSLPEVVGDAGLKFSPMDVDSLAKEMLSVLQDEVAIELSARGRLRAQKFHWDVAAYRTFSVYEHVINAR